MGKERAAVLDLDERGNIVIPQQFKVKLKFSKSVYVSLYVDVNGNRHKMTINRNIDDKFNIRDPKTNKVKQFDFSSGIIPIEQFIFDSSSSQVVVWFDEEKQELVFQVILG